MANDRVYQLPVEVLINPTAEKARLYQEPVEALINPSSEAARVYQLPVEVLAQRNTFTLNAFVAAPPKAFTLNAVIKGTRTASFAIDAVIKATRSASLTVDAQLRVTRAGSFLIDSDVRRTVTGTLTLDAFIGLPVVRIFRDDFNRTTTPLQWLGGTWTWDYYDSRLGDPLQSLAYTDGSHLVVPATNYWDSYSGFPLSATGDMYLDFFVPATWENFQPEFGLLFDPNAYTGLYVGGDSSSDWHFHQLGGDTAYVFTPDVSTWYRVHARWDGSTVSANVWKVADPEPPGWQYTDAQQFAAYDPANDRAPILDLYEFPTSAGSALDNLELWTDDAAWVGFSGFQVAAEIAVGPTASFAIDAVIKATQSNKLPGAYPTLVGTATGTKAWSSGSTLTINTPTGTLNGDVMVAFIVGDPQTTPRTIDPPAGWIQLDQLQADPFTVDANYNTMFAKVASGEGGTQDFTWADSHVGGMAGGIATFRSADFPPLQAGRVVDARTGTHTTTTLDVGPHSIMGAAYAGGESATQSWTQDAALSELWDVWVQYVATSAAWARSPSAGTQGPFTATYTDVFSTVAYIWSLSALPNSGIVVDAFVRPYFRLDAEIVSRDRFRIDALVVAHQLGLFTLSAQVSRQFFHLDAVINPGGRFTANAVVKKSASSSFTLSAEVFAGTHLRSFTANAVVHRAASGSWYVNASIDYLHFENEYAFTLDANQRDVIPSSFTLDARIFDGIRFGSFTLDADSKGQNEKRGAFHIDAVIRQGGGGVFLVGWAIGGNAYFHVDAQIAGWFSLNAEIGEPDFFESEYEVFLDAQITDHRDFFVNALINVPTPFLFTADAEVFAPGLQAGRYFWLDSWFVRPSGTRSFTLDARIGGGFTLDAFIRPYFTLDAFIHTNAVVIWPPDPGGGGGTTPTDPNGNPLPPDFKASRKYQVVIKVGGHDVTGDINWSRTTFTQNAKTNPGTFELVLYGPQPYDGGEDVHVELDGFRTFGGIVLQVERGYVFESDADWPVTTLRGADYNILFDKLITYNRGSADDPSGTYNPYKSFAKGSLDTRIISKVFGSYVDLPAGFDYKLHVTSVGVAAPEKPWAMPTSGSPLRQVMQSLSQVTDAIWWIDPYLRLHYGSRADITAPYPITTGAGGISSRQISMSEDMSQLVTDGFLWGTLAYTVEGEIVMDREQSSYYDSLGPWQYGEFRSDLHHQAYINRRLQSVIQRYGKPIKRAQVVIFEPGYQAGQVAEVILGEHGLDEILVIRSMTLTFAVSKGPGNGLFYCVPRFELSIGLDPEEPWDIYDYLPFKNFPFDDPLGWNRCEDCEQDCQDANPVGTDCGITDDFARTVGAAFGTATCGIHWITHTGTGHSFSVDGVGHVVGGPSAAFDGSVDLPIPYSTFVTVVTLSNYSVSVPMGWINLTAPGYDSSNYLYLDPSTSYVAVLDGLTDDTPSFTFTGAPLMAKIQRSTAGTLAKLWYVGDAEPDWMWAAPVGSRVDQPAVSFQPEVGGSFDVSALHVYDHRGVELTSCSALITDTFSRADGPIAGSTTETGGRVWSAGSASSIVSGQLEIGDNVFVESDVLSLDINEPVPLTQTYRIVQSFYPDQGYMLSDFLCDGGLVTVTAIVRYTGIGLGDESRLELQLTDGTASVPPVQATTSWGGNFTGEVTVELSASSVTLSTDDGHTVTAAFADGPMSDINVVSTFRWNPNGFSRPIIVDNLGFTNSTESTCGPGETVDDFNRTDGAAWGPASGGGTWINDGSSGAVYTVDGNRGVMTLPTVDDGPAQSVLAIGDQTGVDFDYTFGDLVFDPSVPAEIELDTNGFVPDIEVFVFSGGSVTVDTGAGDIVGGFAEDLTTGPFNFRVFVPADRSRVDLYVWTSAGVMPVTPTLSVPSSDPSAPNPIDSLILTYARLE